MNQAIYLLYPDLKDDTKFYVATSKLAAMHFCNKELNIEGSFENLLRAGFIVQRQPVELMEAA